MIKYKDNMGYYALEVFMQNRIPLVEAMLKYKNDKVYPFHTPGHKGGRGMEELLRHELGEGAMAMDVSLMSELDDIHAPTSYIKEAQDLAANKAVDITNRVKIGNGKITISGDVLRSLCPPKSGNDASEPGVAVLAIRK